jgi:hypothetical protein
MSCQQMEPTLIKALRWHNMRGSCVSIPPQHAFLPEQIASAPRRQVLRRPSGLNGSSAIVEVAPSRLGRLHTKITSIRKAVGNRAFLRAPLFPLWVGTGLPQPPLDFQPSNLLC